MKKPFATFRFGRQLFNTLGMVVLAVAVFYSLRYWPQNLPLLPAETDSAANNEPDYSIEDFHAIDLDETGRLRYELTATHLVHYPAPERADLTAPEMVFYRNSADGGHTGREAADAPWQLTAARGHIADAGERLDLEGGVRVARVGSDETNPLRMTMETERLTVFGRQEIATTDSPVKMMANRSQLDGIGMQIDLKKGQMHLLSQVRGTYVPR